jgi:hypothetical protein
MRGRPSCLVTLFLLFSSCFLLSVTADDYVECNDPFPDAVLDLLGLVQIPVKDPVILFLLTFLVTDPGVPHPNSAHPLPVGLTITSKIIPSTVIRI